MQDDLYGDQIFNCNSDSDESYATPAPDTPDLDKLQFVRRISDNYGVQYGKSKVFYNSYVSGVEFKNSGLRPPLYPNRFHGDEIFKLMGSVYLKIAAKYHTKQP